MTDLTEDNPRDSRVPGGVRVSMTEHEFTPDQIEEGIAHAVGDREFAVIPALVKLLAVQSPERAQRVLDALQGRFTVDLSSREVSR